MSTDTILTRDQIAGILVENGILLTEDEITTYDTAIARAIEQTVLQSPEIQAMRKDAKRYRYIKKGNQWIVAATQTGFHVDGGEYGLADAMLEQREDKS